MTPNDLVSIIIPVFNAAKYIERCLNSVCNQSYKELEIIIVDDGSTDRSFPICKKAAEKDNRILCVSKVNEGVSIARNTGIDLSNGRYIFFLDADDYLEDNAIEILMHYMANSTQTLVCGGVNIIKNDVIQLASSDEPFSGENILCGIFCFAGVWIWNKLFDKELIGDLRFDVDLSYAEDLLFLIKYACKCKRIVYTNEVIYNYAVNAFSAIQSTNDEDRFFKKCKQEHIGLCRALMSGNSFDETERYRIVHYILSISMQNLIRAYKSGYNDKEYEKSIKLFYRKNIAGIIRLEHNGKLKLFAIIYLICPHIIKRRYIGRVENL